MRQLPLSQYFREKYEKTQIYLHHTAGADNGEAVLKWWASTKARIGTAFVIERDGDIFQGFNSSYWAYHLGVRSNTFREFGLSYLPLDKFSIGIELTSWGQLTKKNGKFYNYVGGLVDEDEVITLKKPFRGFKHYHKYSEDQIKATKELLCYLSDTYDIPIDYNEDIFDVTKRALSNEKGLYTHCSVRKDKVDIYPDPDMIKMLESL